LQVGACFEKRLEGIGEHPGAVVDLPAPQNGFLYADGHAEFLLHARD
jgi:hypothetical protein